MSATGCSDNKLFLSGKICKGCDMSCHNHKLLNNIYCENENYVLTN